MRAYDFQLIQKIQNGSTTINQNGIKTICRPIPDDQRAHVLDPRIMEMALRKNQLHKKSNTGFSLSGMRHRPDVVSHDLTKSHITQQERLIDLKDRMINVHVFVPEKLTTDALIIFYHGGGFAAGDLAMYLNPVKYLCEQSGAIILFPEYRLAPECPFPAGVNDAYDILVWAYDHASEYGCDKNKMVIVGDSAGGALCHACMIKDDRKRIRLCVSIYPVCELNMIEHGIYPWSYQMYPVIKDHQEVAYDRIDRIKNSQIINELYVRDPKDLKNPLVSSLYHDDFEHFPKTMMIASEYDFLKVGSDYFVEKMHAAGVDVTSVLYMGCDHGFLNLLGIIPQAEDMCQLIAKEIQKLQ